MSTVNYERTYSKKSRNVSHFAGYSPVSSPWKEGEGRGYSSTRVAQKSVATISWRALRRLLQGQELSTGRS